MISKAATVDAFLATLTDEDRAVFAKLRGWLRKAHPQAEESMKYRMPTYLVGEQIIGAFNKQKAYLCLYLNPEAVDPYRRELKAAGVDCGKSCLRFTRPDRLPLPLAAKIIRAAGKLAGRQEPA
jgi:uncharacterized protein YdhG (YjbR/CyaY superfamily)